MVDAPDRGAPSNIKGWLSDIYLPALLSAQEEQLVRRLGERATIDDPLFGRAKGLTAIVRCLHDVAAWLTAGGAAFEKSAFTMGSDRDVTEGSLAVTLDRERATLPIAIVAERRPGREVEIRLYYSTERIQGRRPPRASIVPEKDDLSVPPQVALLIAAVARGDVPAALAAFEHGGTLRDSSGRTYVNGDSLSAYYKRELAAGGQGGKYVTTQIRKGGRADDGRTCALEYTAVREGGGERPGLTSYELGENGLLRAVRIYEDA